MDRDATVLMTMKVALLKELVSIKGELAGQKSGPIKTYADEAVEQAVRAVLVDIHKDLNITSQPELDPNYKAPSAGA